MKTLSLLAFIFLLPILVKAQMTSDALLFSETQPTITARAMGAGNAFGALGGDMSAANFNPAGIAIYRRFEIGLSFGGLFDNTTANFLGNASKDRLSQFAFGNIGFVFAAKLRNQSNKWKSVNVGLTFNRLANYARNFTYDGVSTGSRIQSFAENAYGTSISNLDPYEGWVAYHGYLMDSVAPYTYAPNGGVSDSTYTYKYQNVRRVGGVNELGFTLGANYDHKFYIAGTIGVDFLSMIEDRVYEETADSMDFQTLEFTENRTIKGTGINFKLGMIYRINKFLRVGLAIHTPTAYRLVDSYNSGLYSRIVYDSTLQEKDYPMDDQDPLILQHDLATPWVFMGSVGITIPKIGFIGLDAEYTDYSWASFSLLENERTASNNQFINALNRRVQNAYQGVLKARIGAEFAIDLFRVRLGYQIQTSPYKVAVTGVSDLRHSISGGVGVRWKHFFIDFAYMHVLRDFEFSPYSSSTTIQRIIGNSQTSHAMLTLGASIFRDEE
jgi:hypothetical protein